MPTAVFFHIYQLLPVFTVFTATMGTFVASLRRQAFTRTARRSPLCKRALNPARNVLEDTLHQTRHKIDAGDALFAYGDYKLN
jgi:hypothetical protein